MEKMEKEKTMIKKINQDDGKVILELSRQERIWSCSECGKEFKVDNVPTQCPCGVSDKVFLEKTTPVDESTRRTYLANSNIIFEAEQILKGSIVSMIAKDRVTKNLISRNLISEVKEVTKV